MRVLLVEDDHALGRELRQQLRREGYAVDLTDNGIDAEHMGREEEYDLVILDLGLPARPGLEVLKNWRNEGLLTPVIILTARDAWHEKVDGFKAGADDYVAKPFHVEELQQRIKAVLRRSLSNAVGMLSVAGLSLDEDQQRVKLSNGDSLQLTGMEYRLLRYFMLNPGKILSKSHLTEHIYEYDADHDSNVIEVYVNRLRQKLGKKMIHTLRGQGYVFGDNRH
jgi:DNA-binding response OmpR family regulator